jgi:two-component system phosphate regulon response regulator OmpR
MFTILLIDDDEDLLALMGTYLKMRGIASVTASSTLEARKKLKDFVFDLVVSDYRMPGESGLDFYRSISARYPDIPFVLMSGDADPRIKRRAMDMGANGFLQKPFDLRNLADTIADFARSNSRSEIACH